jgi:MOSC domain-containing protein YiiM
MTTRAKIIEIFIAAKAGEPLVSIPSAHVVPQRGIEGDRYFTGIGSFSRWPGSGRAVSLIEAEVIDAIRSETGLDLSGGRSRRNIVTAGVRLASLNGRKFRIGSVLLRGTRECAPCRYLSKYD